MLKQWSGFLGLVLAAAVAGELVHSKVAWPAEPEPKLSQEVLNLSELVVLRDVAAGQIAPTVGDEVRVLGASLNITGIQSDLEFKIEDPLGDEHLSQQGWVLVQPAGKFKQVTGASELEFSFLLSPIKGGKVVLPTLVLKDPGGKMIARTKSFEVEVGSAISPDDPNPFEMVPARPPISLPFPWWVAIAVVTLLLGVLAGLIYWAIRISRNQKKVAQTQIVVPPSPEDEIAMADLNSLEVKNFPKNLKFKNHYFGVSEIVKNYLSKRFGFDAAESTAKEIIIFFESSKLVSDQILDRIETLFEKLDPVKFSDHVPDIEETKWVIQEAREIVQATRRISTPDPILPASLNSSTGTGATRAP